MATYKYDKTTGQLTKIAGGTLYADLPPGSIVSFGGPVIPTGWLACSGQAISRTDYAELFAVIGTYYGSGNGTTTFNVPDLREATPKGTGLSGKSSNHYSTGGITLGQFVEDRIQQINGQIIMPGMVPGGASPSSNGAFTNTEITGTGRTDLVSGAGDIVFSFDAGRVARAGNTTEVKAVGVNFIIKAKSVGLPVDITNEVDTLVNSMLQEYPKRYRVDGYILNGNVIRGYGRATVMLYANGQAVIDYACRVTTANTASGVFGFGISPKILHQNNSNIPLITPNAGGTVMYYRTGSESGVLYPQQELVHFSGTHNTVLYEGDMYWQFARLYEVGTEPGGWPTVQFPLNSYIQGTCYGTFSV